MQETQQPQQQENGGPASPLKVFAILLALLLIAGTAIYLLTRERTTPTAAPVTQEADNGTLTEEEAIERLKELLALEAEMYRTLDESLIGQVIHPGSPVEDTGRNEIRELNRNGITDQSSFEIQDTDVVALTQSEVQIRVTAILQPRLIDYQGEDVTDDSRPRAQTVLFTLRESNGIWRLFDALIEKAQFVQ